MTSKNLSINYQKLERTQRLWAFWYESLPLSLEEIFIYETERIGYDIKELIY